MHRFAVLVSVLVLPGVMVAPARGATEIDRDAFRKQIEADWLLQEQSRHQPTVGDITTQADAAGACDGVKNGKWGFHTGVDAPAWWQVDLGEVVAVDRVRVWNRCDNGSAVRADRLRLRLSDDGKNWRDVYKHDGKTFFGHKNRRPLVIRLKGERARYVRVQLPGKSFLHLDEVEVFGPEAPRRNLALKRPADQSSTSQWSSRNLPPSPIVWSKRVERILSHCRRLIDQRSEQGVDTTMQAEAVGRLAAKLRSTQREQVGKGTYYQSRWILRRLALADPLLDFDAILVTKRVPGSYSHMSDQYYGWWSRPGGGIHVMRDYKTAAPKLECISDSFSRPGSFLRPTLSYDGKKVLFAWCRHYAKLAAEKDKLNKANVPEDAFYHVFEMGIDGKNVRKLTRGKYDDFDARYLPDGRIVFLSTRRGQFVQVNRETARQTVDQPDLPDIYVRCGGGPPRPVAVYTLHSMDADGGNMCAISPFEMFEWTPDIANDGTILYSRWDYVDRWNMPFMSLWATNPDGTNAHIVYGNYTHSPHCTFEPRSVPNSDKIIFTASGHHAQTMGSLVLHDPSMGTEGTAPITRLTPEVVFPEIEGWPETFFANPWPLSERVHLVSWGREKSVSEGRRRAANGMGVYLFDADGEMELLYRDPEITSGWPISIKPRPRPPVIASHVKPDGPQEGRFLLVDVYHGLERVKRGLVKSLRIIAVPGKTHPTMNFPVMGVTQDDPGKCVLGTVPVEADGSAHFRVPAGVIVFFQALDERGVAIQTMRTTTHVQRGQTLSCIGCHEQRNQAPPRALALAARREPSKITVGPSGSWPLRFDRLIQPMLDRNCVSCHSPASCNEHAAGFDLTAGKAYATLLDYGKPSLRQHVSTRYREGVSKESGCPAGTSVLLSKLTRPKGHHGIKLGPENAERLITWMDSYAQRLGSFDVKQEQRLIELRKRSADLLIEREHARTARR